MAGNWSPFRAGAMPALMPLQASEAMIHRSTLTSITTFRLKCDLGRKMYDYRTSARFDFASLSNDHRRDYGETDTSPQEEDDHVAPIDDRTTNSMRSDVLRNRQRLPARLPGVRRSINRNPRQAA